MRKPMVTTQIPTTAMDISPVQMDSCIKYPVRLTSRSTRQKTAVNTTLLTLQVVKIIH